MRPFVFCRSVNFLQSVANDMSTETFSIKARYYKAFGETDQGFDTIRPVNVIIGRNNAGKSTLLDLVGHATKNTTETIPSSRRGSAAPTFILSNILTKHELQRVFPESTSGGPIPGNHWAFGRRLVGARLTWQMGEPGKNQGVALGQSPDGSEPMKEIREGAQSGILNNLANQAHSPLAAKSFHRLFADRDIVAEQDDGSATKISGDGVGATRAIQRFSTRVDHQRDLIHEVFLAELNRIFEPDSHFVDIVVRQAGAGGVWEIYLKEARKGLVPLSQSGSGLKTVILTLAFIHLIPAIEQKPLSEFVFAFEELENNLHPALIRRLLAYLREKAVGAKCTIFLTTHSNVAIDVFSRDAQAQIIHVTHDGTDATCRPVTTYIHNKGILDDLDVRASDLLQANGIVWVEGPSDRIYLNRLIQLWGDGRLVENQHYQCVFYGGRLLAHLSATEEAESGVAILHVNRNAALVMDSDRRSSDASVNKTKRRLSHEIARIGGFAWMTEGREIENYITPAVLARWLSRDVASIRAVGPYENFFDYLDEIQNGLGSRYREQKPLLAEILAPLMQKDDLNAHGLPIEMDNLCKSIRVWNKLAS